jgi:hypothetical protein
VPQVIVYNSGRRRECVADFAHTDSNDRAFNHAIRERTLLVKIQSVDAHIAGHLRIKASDETRAV